jgi:hypothetical protein
VEDVAFGRGATSLDEFYGVVTKGCGRSLVGTAETVCVGEEAQVVGLEYGKSQLGQPAVRYALLAVSVAV